MRGKQGWCNEYFANLYIRPSHRTGLILPRFCIVEAVWLPQKAVQEYAISGYYTQQAFLQCPNHEPANLRLPACQTEGSLNMCLALRAQSFRKNTVRTHLVEHRATAGNG